MKHDLIAWSDRTLHEKIELPQERFWEDTDDRREAGKQRAREKLKTTTADTIILGDADADGLGATAAIRDYHDEHIPLIPCGAHGGDIYLGDALWICLDELNPDTTIIITDIAIDEQWKVKALPKLHNKGLTIKWFDHHEWEPDIETFVREHTDYLELDTGEDNPDNDEYNARCTAMMMRDYYQNHHGHTYPEHLNEAFDIIGEYDLWRLRDTRCFDLEDLTDILTPDEYLSQLKAHGADIVANNPDIEQELDALRHEHARMEKHVIENVETHDIGEWTVALVYGNCPHNLVAEKIRNDGIADVTAFIKPHGGLSFRGSENFEFCHKIAEKFGGGGHAKAAAGYPDVFDSMLDYANHWTTHGDDVKLEVLTAFEDMYATCDMLDLL